MEPLVSVIIPCFNCERYVEQAITSIMKQSYENMEILITDDCSTDGTLAILKRLAEKDCRIRIFEHTQNLKIVRTLNELTAVSCGKYIARMDADDISGENRIRKQVSFMEDNPECAICGTNAWYINENGQKLRQSSMPLSAAENKFFMRYYSTLMHPAILARSEVLKENPYDEIYLYAEDYELWCRLIFEKNFKVCNIPETLFCYRMFSGQSSVTNSRKQWETSAVVFDRYPMVDNRYKDIHKEIFYLRSQNLTSDKIEYIYTVHKRLMKECMPYSAPVEEKLIYYLHTRHADWRMFRILLSRLGIYTIIYNMLKKYQMRNQKKG